MMTMMMTSRNTKSALLLASLLVIFSLVHRGDTEELSIHSTPQHGVLFSEKQSLMRFPVWSLLKYPSLAIEFSTYEPVAILFHAMKTDGNKNFYQIEIFEGDLYFVYGDKNIAYRTRINPQGHIVSNGKRHSVNVTLANLGKFSIRFDNNPVAVKNPEKAFSFASFNTYTYIGGVDSYKRLSWDTWARQPFYGCIHAISLRPSAYIDFGNQILVSNKERLIIPTNGTMAGFKCDANVNMCANAASNPCQNGLCGARSYPYLQEGKNFACYCHTKEMTYLYNRIRIDRSVPCSRKSWVFKGDTESYILIKFYELQQTHIDRIQISFKTDSKDAVIFFTTNNLRVKSDDSESEETIKVKKTHKSKDQFGSIYQMLEIRNELLFLKGNIAKKPQDYLISTNKVNDNKWHTFYMLRKANIYHMWIDDEKKLAKPFQIPERLFYNEYVNIYVGIHKIDEGFYFKGEISKFYWNQYAFFGSEENPDYQVIKQLKRPEQPEKNKPKFPPSTIYSIEARHKYSQLAPINFYDFKKDFFYFIMAFKTDFDGILFHMHEKSNPNNYYVTFALINGFLCIISKFGNEYRNQIPTPHKMTRSEWQRVLFVYEKHHNRFSYLINKKKEYFTILDKASLAQFREVEFYLYGVPNQATFDSLNSQWDSFRPNTLSKLSFVNFVGYTDLVFMNINNYDFGYLNLTTSKSVPSEYVYKYELKNLVKCKKDICKNKGVCKLLSATKLKCICKPEFYGKFCQFDKPTCEKNYCKNGGRCYIDLQSSPPKQKCKCKGTFFRGKRCTEPDCPNEFCKNGGYCYFVRELIDQPLPFKCNCSVTNKYTGERCEIPPLQCPKKGEKPFCENNGFCYKSPDTKQLKCRCEGTGYSGEKCTKRECPKGKCLNGGVCEFTPSNDWQCNCTKTRYFGSRCEIATCAYKQKGLPPYCANGGICRIQNNQHNCDCSQVPFTGPFCNRRTCFDSLCLYGGKCVMESEQFNCICKHERYGKRCEQAVCPNDFCMNYGVCVAKKGRPSCLCKDGWKGQRCDEPYPKSLICNNKNCKNNGVCQMLKIMPNYLVARKYFCDCRNTGGFTGDICEIPTKTRPSCPDKYCNSPRGRCVRATLNWYCMCNPGFIGDYCQFEDKCPGFCKNGGRCTMVNGLPQCQCPIVSIPGQTSKFYRYYGRRCEKELEKIETNCPKSYCKNGGKCYYDRTSSQLKCRCVSSVYYGERCQLVKDPCKDHCLNEGECSVTGSVPACKCPTSHYGARCEHQYKCLKQTCLNGGVCKRIRRSDTKTDLEFLEICECPEDVYGSNCAVKCSPNPCKHGGRCGINEVGRLACNCTGTQHIGRFCEITGDIDGRSGGPTPCLNGGQLYTPTGANKSECDCAATRGYYGKRCEKPTDCLKYGRCKNAGHCISLANSKSKYRCDCAGTGYSGRDCSVRCPRQMCKNGGRCFATGTSPEQIACDCSGTNHFGKYCEKAITVALGSFFGKMVGAPAWLVALILCLLLLFTALLWICCYCRAGCCSCCLSCCPACAQCAGVAADGKALIAGGGVGGAGYIGGGVGGALAIGAAGAAGGGAASANGGAAIGGGVGGTAGVVSEPLLVASESRNETMTALRSGGLAGAAVPGSLGGSEGASVLGSPQMMSGNTLMRMHEEEERYAGQHEHGAAGVAVYGAVEQQQSASKFHNKLIVSGGYNGNESSGIYATQEEMEEMFLTSNLQKEVSASLPDYNSPPLMIAENSSFAVSGKPQILFDEQKNADSVLFTKDSRLVVSGSAQESIVAWDAHTGDFVRTFNTDQLRVTSLVLTSNERLLVGIAEASRAVTSGDENAAGPPLRTLQVWDFETAQRWRGGHSTAPPIYVTAVAACHRRPFVLACRVRPHIGGADFSGRHAALMLFDPHSNTVLRETPINLEMDLCGGGGEGGQQLDGEEHDEAALLHNATSHHVEHHLEIASILVSDDDRFVVAAAFVTSPHAAAAAATATAGVGASHASDATAQSIILIVLDERSHTILSPRRICVVGRPGTQCFIAGGAELVVGTHEGTLTVWDLSTVREIGQLELERSRGGAAARHERPAPPHSGCISVLAASSKYLVSGATDSIIIVWSLARQSGAGGARGGVTASFHCQMTDHMDEVSSLCISRDEELLLSGSLDGSIQVWMIETQQKLSTFSSNIDVKQVSMSPDARVIVGLGVREGVAKLISLEMKRTRHLVMDNKVVA